MEVLSVILICAFKGMNDPTGNNEVKLALLVTLPKFMTSTENVLYDDFSVLDPCTSVYFLTSKMLNRICIALITPLYLRTPYNEKTVTNAHF